MSLYTDYIQGKLQDIADSLAETIETQYTIRVSNELSFNFNPKKNDILVVIKELAGSVTENVRFLPIQFDVFTGADEINDTKAILNMFVNNYSNTHTMLGADYYKQDYQTPVDTQNFLQIGSDERAFILVNGTLMITNSISDVTGVEINGEKINYTNINIGYSTNENTRKLTTENLQKHLVSTSNLTITISCYCNIGGLNTMIHLLKRGIKSPNDSYSIKLTYNDGTTENYNCIIKDFTELHDISTPPTRTISFELC